MIRSTMYVSNAFSLSMVPETVTLRVETIDPYEALVLATQASARGWLVSALGHADIAMIVSEALQQPLGVNRISVFMSEPWDRLLVAQYTGPRLPEGATELPEGARITWKLVTYRYPI
jgi:hypothetical protein